MLSRNTLSEWHSSRLLVFWTSLANKSRFLGSFITKVHGGYTIQTDTETLLAGLRDLNLEHCKPSKLPGATPRTHDLTPLEPSEHKLYRRVVGRFLYCSAIEETLLSRSISCAVVYNPRQ